MRRQISVEQFHAELKSQGVPRDHLAFKCVICATVQSAQDLINAGAGPDFEAVERFLGFSCVGRFTNAGEHVKGEQPGRGCNWSLGGFFTLHTLEVLVDGEKCPRFEPATPEEAQQHMRGQVPKIAETAPCG